MGHRFFSNKDCKYYPCHFVEDEDMNCMFCFCPLYPLDNCGGNYTVGKCGKDCSQCTLPHNETGYDYVIAKLKDQK